MSWKHGATSVIQKTLSGLKKASSVKVGMSSYQQKCNAKSLSEPIDPAGCPAKCLMDNITEPCGDWKENYERQNTKDTRILIAGTSIFLFTCFLVKRDGFIKGYPYSSLF